MIFLENLEGEEEEEEGKKKKKRYRKKRVEEPLDPKLAAHLVSFKLLNITEIDHSAFLSMKILCVGI